MNAHGHAAYGTLSILDIRDAENVSETGPAHVERREHIRVGESFLGRDRFRMSSSCRRWCSLAPILYSDSGLHENQPLPETSTQLSNAN